MAPPRTEEEWELLRKHCTDFAYCYRNGLVQQWSPLTRRRALQNLQLPKQGRWPGHNPNHAFTNVDPDPVDLLFYRNENLLQREPAFAVRRAREAVEAATSNLSEYGLVFKKVLGWGGLGAAALFELRDPATNSSRDVVVKCDLNPNNALVKDEKIIYQYLARARHIVQHIPVRHPSSQPAKRKSRDVADDGPSTTKKRRKLQIPFGRSSRNRAQAVGSDEAPPPPAGWIDPAQRQPPAAPSPPKPDLTANDKVLVLEFMKRGNLDKWINKMGSTGGSFSSKVLWRFFECFFKGVVAMAHPPIFYNDYRETGGINGPIVEERLPGPASRLSKDLIHFDLDPSNILVGEFNQGNAHDLTPMLKINDFGVTQEIGFAKNNKATMWESRRFGKNRSGYLTPEQFHEEWDWVDTVPAAMSPKPKIAGNYSWKTNLYSVGLIMWSLITLCYAPDSPYPTYVEEDAIDGGNGGGRWTYGAYVLSPRFNHIDFELRQLVVNLMMEDPAHRPDLDTLAELVHAKVDPAEWPNEDDAQTREWARDFFGQPGVAGPAEPPPSDQMFVNMLSAFNNVSLWPRAGGARANQQQRQQQRQQRQRQRLWQQQYGHQGR